MRHSTFRYPSGKKTLNCYSNCIDERRIKDCVYAYKLVKQTYLLPSIIIINIIQDSVVFNRRIQ